MSATYALKPSPGSLSLRAALEHLFPLDGNGTQPSYPAFLEMSGAVPKPYDTPPIYPPDLFAAAAYLLELSGAYHHVTSAPPERDRETRRIVVTPSMRAKAVGIAEAWQTFKPDRHFVATDQTRYRQWLANEGAPVLELFALWDKVFVQCGDQPVFRAMGLAEEPPIWWEAALMLFMAADEAAQNLGWKVLLSGDERSPSPWFDQEFSKNYGERFVQRDDEFGGPAGFDPGINTLSSASPDAVTVLPKARTTSVGCTLRSLSHHLALLPPRGVARGSWTPFLFTEAPPDEQHMNVLLVPFPFSISAADFSAEADYTNAREKFGYFDIEQSWVKNASSTAISLFVEELVVAAKRECDGIHGVVLPELALDHDSYHALRGALVRQLPEIEFLIAGVSESEEGGDLRRGNFVSVTLFQEHVRDGSEASMAGGNPDDMYRDPGLVTQREKHHRWKLDRHQILEYGLEGFLNPSYQWWENIDLLNRRVDFAVVRAGTVISAMICEDLARVDPCQELLRAVGPNILFAILMDAPQLKARWPARYATILAEDPGSAVLTLTSRALMTRQHTLRRRVSDHDGDRVVALWRDDEGTPVEISCPHGAHAVRLTLSASRVPDVTLDGRVDDMAVAWRYASHSPVRLRDPRRFEALLGPDDLACL